MIVIRDSVREDIPAVAEFLDECWKIAYKNILDKEYLNALSSVERAARLRQGFDEKKSDFLVALDNNRIVGAGAVGESHAGNYPHDGEIMAIYVHQDYLGSGLGGSLYAVMEDKLRKRGYTHLVLTVFRGNARAIAFYGKHGFNIIDESAIDFGGNSYPVSVMRKELS
jgi:ribosomal protein S18 acetylase RimI-like enzyme